jgi:hypothetical protein
MPLKYELFLSIKGTSAPEYECEIMLDVEEESNKAKLELKFQQERDKIRETLQAYVDRHVEPPRGVGNEFLNDVLQAWMREIGEGQFTTILTRDLPVLTNDEIDKLEDDGYRVLPEALEFIPPDINDIEPTIGVLPPLDF